MLSNGFTVNMITVAAALWAVDINTNAGTWTRRLRFQAAPMSENRRASQIIASVSGAQASQVRMPHEKTRDAAWFIPAARISR